MQKWNTKSVSEIKIITTQHLMDSKCLNVFEHYINSCAFSTISLRVPKWLSVICVLRRYVFFLFFDLNSSMNQPKIHLVPKGRLWMARVSWNRLARVELWVEFFGSFVLYYKLAMISRRARRTYVLSANWASEGLLLWPKKETWNNLLVNPVGNKKRDINAFTRKERVKTS